MEVRAFITELRRRKVIRVGTIYAVVALAVAQAADVMLPGLQLPDWSVTLVLGFHWLDRALGERDSWLLFLDTDPLFAPLRGDPRFLRLRAEVLPVPS